MPNEVTSLDGAMSSFNVLICIAVLLAAAGCNKASDPPAPQPDFEAMAAVLDAEAEARAAGAHLTLSMTDEQILRAIGVDPAAVKLKPPPEGYNTPSYKKVAYTNETVDIEIDRMLNTGQLLVYGTQGRWLVKGKQP
jgi:hypothetical protein